MTALDCLILYAHTCPIAFVFFFFNFGNVKTFSGRICYAVMYAMLWVLVVVAASFESFEEEG